MAKNANGKIVFVPEVTPDTDSFEIQVEYTNADEKPFTKPLKIYNGNFKSVADVQALIDEQIDKLDSLEDIRVKLLGEVGKLRKAKAGGNEINPPKKLERGVPA